MMGPRQTYTIVAGDGSSRPLDAGVSIRTYGDVKCKCCGAQAGEMDYNARMNAAYADGLALGEMLHEYGAGEYRRGLLAGLQVEPR